MSLSLVLSIVSTIVESRLQRAGDAAVLADPPEVDRHQERRDQRQEDDMQGVEANERRLADFFVTLEQEVDLRAEDRGRATDLACRR